METTGALKMELVDYVFSKFCEEDRVKEDILNMMEQFGLIVMFAPSPKEKMYFVPCQLKTPPGRICQWSHRLQIRAHCTCTFWEDLFLAVFSVSLFHD